eukprot:Nk52_evm1s78 gene=Nk52_evmTU1s78
MNPEDPVIDIGEYGGSPGKGSVMPTSPHVSVHQEGNLLSKVKRKDNSDVEEVLEQAYILEATSCSAGVNDGSSMRSIAMGTLCMTCGIVGGGSITVPYACALTGLWWGLSLIALTGFLSGYGAYLLSQLGHNRGQSYLTSYSAIAHRAYGNKAGSFVQGAQFLELIADTVLYLLLISTSMYAVFPSITEDEWTDKGIIDFMRNITLTRVFGRFLQPLELLFALMEVYQHFLRSMLLYLRKIHTMSQPKSQPAANMSANASTTADQFLPHPSANPPAPIRAGTRCAVSWSGGKDSCSAMLEAKEKGCEIVVLITMMDKDGLRSRSHALSEKALREQAKGLGIPIIFGRADWETYEEELIRLLGIAHNEYHVKRVIFGDIDLQAHLEWELNVCIKASKSLGLPSPENYLIPYLPIWQWSRRAVLEKYILRADVPVKCLVVCVDNKKMIHMPDGKHSTWYLGKILDSKMMQEFEASGIDPCGENGEFHTFVVSCPGMKPTPGWEKVCLTQANPQYIEKSSNLVINTVENLEWKSSHSFLDVDVFFLKENEH